MGGTCIAYDINDKCVQVVGIYAKGRGHLEDLKVDELIKLHRAESFLRTNILSAAQEILCLLYNLDVHCHVHSSPHCASFGTSMNLKKIGRERLDWILLE
jgi:hypothetical protein